MWKDNRPYGFVKPGGTQIASSLSTFPHGLGEIKSGNGDNLDNRALWDEEFLGHNLPVNYSIVSVETSISQHLRVSGSGKGDASKIPSFEQAMWDDEFLGHQLPSNYCVSLEKLPSKYRRSLEKTLRRLLRRKVIDSSTKRGFGKLKDLEKTGRKTVSCGHGRSERAFDSKTSVFASSYPRCGRNTKSCSRNGCWEPGIVGGLGNGSARNRAPSNTSSMACEDCILWLRPEDSNTTGKKLLQSDNGLPSAIYHSSLGSDTISLVSTLDSCSFSSTSEASSSAKADSFSQSQSFSYSTLPANSVSLIEAEEEHPSEIVHDDGQFVELTLLSRITGDASNLKDSSALNALETGKFLEFNFLDGRLVERPVYGVASEELFSRLKKNDVSLHSVDEKDVGARTATYETETTQYLRSSGASRKGCFGTAINEWSGGYGTSSDLRDTSNPCYGDEHDDAVEEASVQVKDPSSTRKINRLESLSSGNFPLLEAMSLDSLSFVQVVKNSKNSNVDKKLHPCDRNESVDVKHNHLIFPSLDKTAILGKRTLNPSLFQVTSRRTRSLGSVLSQQLAFTAIPSFQNKRQVGRVSEKKNCSWAAEDSSVNLSSEWPWVGKDMKTLHPLGALTAREFEFARVQEDLARTVAKLSARGPPERSPSAAFKEEKSSYAMLRFARFNGGNVKVLGNCQGKSVSVRRSDILRKTRASTVGPWASLSELYESSSERLNTCSRGTKLPFLSASAKKVKSGTNSKRSGVTGSLRSSVKFRSSLRQHVPQNLILELEVMCGPFGPVLKSGCSLPITTRIRSFRPATFTHAQLGEPAVLEATPETKTSSATTSTLQFGRVQYVVSGDGYASYCLIMDKCEEILVAKKVGLSIEGASQLYVFHSSKGKERNKIGHWKQWGKKEKSLADFAGNMKVTSTVASLRSCDGFRSYLVSEFVLLDGLAARCNLRSSLSPWDATPLNPRLSLSSTFSSLKSTYFRLPYPANAPVVATECDPGLMPALVLPSSRYLSQSMPSAAITSRLACANLKKNSISFGKGTLGLKHLDRLRLPSPSQYRKNGSNTGSWSEIEAEDESETTSSRFSVQSQAELAAVVVRTPIGRDEDKRTASGDVWGWGINFLKNGATLDDEKGKLDNYAAAKQVPEALYGASEQSSDVDCAAPTSGSCSGLREGDEACCSCGRVTVNDRCKGGMSVTLLLPAGSHGIRSNGLDGPQPLVQRWKSGGKCDCGNWDLGCGLKILDTYDTVSSGKLTSAAGLVTDLHNHLLKLCLHGQKHDNMGLTLSAFQEGCYALSFQAPITSIQAFATAVAVLHCRDSSHEPDILQNAKLSGKAEC